jgi:hypothetical protein
MLHNSVSKLTLDGAIDLREDAYTYWLLSDTPVVLSCMRGLMFADHCEG